MGLEAGADDYVCKPFSSREIMARVAALIRRAEHNFALAADPAVNHAIDELSKRISWKGNWLGLSNSEFQILAALMKQPGRVFSREQLLDQIGFGFRDVSDRAIDSHVKNIRRKVSTIDPGATCIASVYGAGYRFQTDPS
jgi:two-component system response regulator BaeR